MMFLIQPPRRVELARLKIAADASIQSLRSKVDDVRATAHTLGTETLGEAVKQHPFIAMGVAAAGGFVAYHIVKARGLPIVTLSAMQSVATQIFAALKKD
jgi:hypothetical protein